MSYPVLERIRKPEELRKLSLADLLILVESLRSFIQSETSEKEGHIKSSLGVVELSIALHYHFNTPEDILIWDVGHQAYAHKVLTERKEDFASNRKQGGIAGFTKRSESKYDPFGSGHSSASISALAGFIKAAQLNHLQRKHIAVIGDGALTGGQAFEALNFLGEEQSDCLIVFNDNQSSIDPNIGALQARDSYRAWSEALGFQYHSTESGNNLESLLGALNHLSEIKGPLFWHLRTHKGLGYKAKNTAKAKTQKPSFQSTFGTWVLAALAENPKLVVLSPAMLAGANLSAAKAKFPDRVIDVGIAEQHVVTMAAGLAAAGMKPLVHLYSTFAQRAIDQIIHDVALQKLGVTFVLDRAGYVGEDGPTHHGVFDQSLLMDIPNIRLGAPSGGRALSEMLDWAMSQSEGPVFLRYPKDNFDPEMDKLWRSYRPHWWHQSAKKVFISYGKIAEVVQAAAKQSGWGHLHIPIARPFPKGDVLEQLKNAKHLILVDENPDAGSVHHNIAELIATGELELNYQHVTLAADFMEHACRSEQLKTAGLSLDHLLSLSQNTGDE